MANSFAYETPTAFSAGPDPSQRISHWILRGAIVAVQLSDRWEYLPYLRNVADLELNNPMSLAMLGELAGALLLLLGGALNRLGCDLCTRVGAATMLAAVPLMSSGIAAGIFDVAISGGAVNELTQPQALTPLALAYVFFRGRHI